MVLYILARKMRKILAIRLGAIGDVILTSAAVLNLKISFPEARIFFLTRKHTAGLLKQFMGVDEILEFPSKASFIDLFRMGEYLDKLAFEIIIDLHGNIRSKYLMCHIAAPIKVQYHKRRFERFAAVKWKKLNPDAPHTIDLYNDAVLKCGGKIFARRPVLRLDGYIGTALDFGNSLPIVAIAPGASFPPKQWFPDRFRSLTLEIFERIPANIVLIMADYDAEFGRLKEEIPPDRLRVFANVDLNELSYIISQTDLLVCNDSALSHVGSAVGTPVVAIFGPTHPTLGFAPRGMRDVIVQVDEYCRPCSLHGKRPCYRDRQYCFERISVQDVFEKASELISGNAKGEKALFIDRDGTLIKEKGFLDNPDGVEPEDGAVDAVRMARQAGYKVIVLSNQSGVARGYFGEDAVERVNQRIMSLFEDEGAKIDDIFFCPHLPDAEVPEYAIECDCRKPSPGMIEKACRKHNINPFLSYVIGDKLSDINLACVAGARGILVRTGYGRAEEKKLQNSTSIGPEYIAKTLHDAVNYIVEAPKGQLL